MHSFVSSVGMGDAESITRREGHRCLPFAPVKAATTQLLMGNHHVDGYIVVCAVTTEGARFGRQRGSTLAAACLRLMRARCSSRDDFAFDLIGSAAAVFLRGA